jgi:hypothetical protein
MEDLRAWVTDGDLFMPLDDLYILHLTPEQEEMLEDGSAEYSLDSLEEEIVKITCDDGEIVDAVMRDGHPRNIR